MGNDGAKGGGGKAGGAGRVGRTVKLTQAQIDAQDLEKIKAFKESLEREAQAFRGGITEAENDAILKYTGSYYRDLNLMLYTGREDEMDSDMRRLKNNLDTGLAKLPRFDETTYRGLRFYDEEERMSFVGQFVEGDYVKMPAFTSSAATEQGFGYNHYDTGNGVQIEFRSKQGRDLTGKKGGRAYNTTEQEVIFERNTTFRVVSRTKTANDGWKIVVTDD